MGNTQSQKKRTTRKAHKVQKAQKAQKVQKTRKVQKATKTKTSRKGRPSLNADAFKPNTVRRGVDGYWWTVIEAQDVRWQDDQSLFADLDPKAQHVWRPHGNHATKNGKTPHKRWKLEMTEERKKALENDGIITVAFNLTPGCEKSGKLPKSCDLEREAMHTQKPLQPTGWSFGLFDYATAPTDTYKYIHTYEGGLDTMKAAVAALKNHYTEHKQEGAISKFRITTETNKEVMKRHWDF